MNIRRVATPANEAKANKLPVLDQVMLIHNLRHCKVPEVRYAMVCQGMNVAEYNSDDILMVCHQARLKIEICTSEEKRASEEWLRFHNRPILK